jgi:hypothetical protein
MTGSEAKFQNSTPKKKESADCADDADFSFDAPVPQTGISAFQTAQTPH